jgi:hypothetical protein
MIPFGGVVPPAEELTICKRNRIKDLTVVNKNTT